MKKFLSILLLIVILSPISLSANSVPYRSFIATNDGAVKPTSPIYLPKGTLPYYFESPSDIYVDEDNVIYVADGNKVIRFTPDGQGLIYENELMEKANGIFVSEQLLYVADPEVEAVFVFDYSGALIDQVLRPDVPSFGSKTKYKPTNVIVSPNQKMYITSEGLTDGIININENGTFLGFYGANDSKESIYSFDMMNSEALGGFFRPTPPSVSDIAVDEAGYIYTSTNGLEDSVRKLNVSSTNVLDGEFETDLDTIEDIWVDQYGNIYTLTAEAEQPSIWVNDPDGNLLFCFTYALSSESSLGVLDTPTAITVDSNQNIYVTDAGLHQVVIYRPSQLANSIFEGSALFNNGELEQANEIWSDFIKYYPDFGLAYESLGQEQYKAKNYEGALDYFEKGSNEELYSNSKNHIRREWLNNNFTILLGLFVLLLVLRYLYKKFLSHKVLAKIDDKPFVTAIRFIKHIVRHPEDGFYQLKYKDQGSVLTSTVIYLVFSFIYIFNPLVRGFLFGHLEGGDINVVYTFVMMVIVFALLLVSHSLVSSIMFGEASFKLLYKSFAYVLIPYIIMMPLIVVFSNVLTLNESFIISFMYFVISVWSFIITFKLISELQNYEMSTTFKNMLLTFFTMMVILCVTITFGFLTFELFRTILDIIVEVIS